MRTINCQYSANMCKYKRMDIKRIFKLDWEWSEYIHIYIYTSCVILFTIVHCVMLSCKNSQTYTSSCLFSVWVCKLYSILCLTCLILNEKSCGMKWVQTKLSSSYKNVVSTAQLSWLCSTKGVRHRQHAIKNINLLLFT